MVGTWRINTNKGVRSKRTHFYAFGSPFPVCGKYIDLADTRPLDTGGVPKNACAVCLRRLMK